MSTQLGLLLWVAFTVGTGLAAANKGRSVGLWLLLGFLFGIFALAAVALLPESEERRRFKSKEKEPFVPVAEPVRPQTYGKCPSCGRIAFTADDSGDYYCYACRESVQLVR
jgi:hypothetical protein